MNEPQRIAVLSPVFNDWACLTPFLKELAKLSDLPGTLDVFIVDDGSTDPLPEPLAVPQGRVQVEILRLGANLGHQRAIAAGLVELSIRGAYDAIVVMDADGEDSPSAIDHLWQAHVQDPQAIIVAKRAQRTETTQFQLSYRAYKVFFRVLTGRVLDFGNFSLLPSRVVNRVVLMPELWNHYPATLMRSRLHIVRVPIDRGHRYAGRSRMNFTSLVNHGLAGISVFIDTAFARLLAFSFILMGLLVSISGAGLVFRLVTSVPMPGWLALGATAAFIGLMQVIAALAVLSFLTLSLRSTPSPPPSETAPAYVAERIKVPKA